MIADLVVPVVSLKIEHDPLPLATATVNAHAHEDGTAELIAIPVTEVPRQTSVTRDLEFEEERAKRQREQLDADRDTAADLERIDGTGRTARGPEESAMSIREALPRRLEV
ncbi:hypothetical protein [Halopiger thermotolerans]